MVKHWYGNSLINMFMMAKGLALQPIIMAIREQIQASTWVGAELLLTVYTSVFMPYQALTASCHRLFSDQVSDSRHNQLQNFRTGHKL